MWTVLRYLALAATLTGPQALLLAHHSLAAEFDSAKPVVLHGKVTQVAWTNPHVYLWMDVVGADGSITNWMLESAAPNFLQGLGWTKQSVKAGDTVTVRAFLAKDRANAAKTDSIDLPDGRHMTTGHAVDSVRERRSP